MNSGKSSRERSRSELETAGGSKQGRVRIFAIFDVEHDGDLYELLDAQSGRPGSGFEVVGGSQTSQDTDAWRASVRRRIRNSDQVIVICGEHTDESPRIHAELLIARDEEKSYFLLWGRREIMCTKPIGAEAAEGMYSWTPQFLHDQILFHRRKAARDAAARSLRKVTPSGH